MKGLMAQMNQKGVNINMDQATTGCLSRRFKTEIWGILISIEVFFPYKIDLQLKTQRPLPFITISILISTPLSKP